jgi:hypothetical protein
MEEKFESFAILELMGHRKLAGKVSETTIFGGVLIRIDIPGKDGNTATQFYSPAAVYCITPTTEVLAKAYAQNNKPQPITKWDLPGVLSITPGKWAACTFLDTCTKNLMCQDCDVYLDATRDLQE